MELGKVPLQEREVVTKGEMVMKRIDDLIKQSRLRYNEHQSVEMRNAELKAFAKAIIDDCVAVCKSQRDPSNLNYKPSERFVEAIKLHFGEV